MTTAKEMIETERQRQVSEERYDSRHDDEARDGELLQAGICYLNHARAPDDIREQFTTRRPLGWIWGAEYWKPKTRTRDMVRAGALFLAERDRLQRLGWPHHHVDHKIELAIRLLDEDLAAHKVA
jgi:hypothetical protein